MKRNALVLIVFGLALALTTQGFQCGSPEFAGAKLKMQQKDYKEAIRLLEVETQKNPGNEEAWYLLGLLKSDQDDYAGMNQAFESALKISDKHAKEIKTQRYNNWATRVNHGIGFLERGSSDSLMYYDKAVDEFKMASTAWPDTAITYRYIAYAYNNKQDWNNAISNFQMAWDKGGDIESLKRMGRIYIQRGKEHKDKFETDNAEKIRILKTLNDVNRSSRKADVMKSLGAPDATKKASKTSKKEDWTYTKYNLKISFDGENLVSKTFSEPYDPKIDSTEYKVALGEFGSAIHALDTAEKADPKDNEILNLILQAFVESNRIAEAIEAFKLSVVNEPGNKTNYYILGVLYRTNGNYTQAIEHFKSALKIDPDYGDALFDLGATYYNWGVEILKASQEKGEDTDEYKTKFKEALPYLEKTSEIKATDPQVWETLGTIYARLGQAEKAMKALDQADKIRKGN